MIPEAGVGIVYVPSLRPLLEGSPDLVDVVEIEPQTLWLESPGEVLPYRVDDDSLAAVEALPHPKLVHGIGFPVGGSRRPDPAHIPPLLHMAERLQPLWMSEHLSFNIAEGSHGFFNTGFLLPPRHTLAGAEAAAATIAGIAAQMPRPFAVETGVNYLRPRADELSDGRFISEVVERADCGILFDIHNAWANELNGRQSVLSLIEEIPRERVLEVHIAGGEELDGFWLDSHSGAIPHQLVELAYEILPRLPNLRAIIFEATRPAITELGTRGIAQELDKIRALWEARGVEAVEPTATRASIRVIGNGVHPSPEDWEDVLGALVVGRRSESPLAEDLSRDPGVDLVNHLIIEFRAGMLVESLRLTVRLLLLSLGEEPTRALIDEFCADRSPQLFKSSEGESFARFLVAKELDVPYLDEVLRFERAVLRSLTRGEDVLVPFSHDPLVVLRSLTGGALPTVVKTGAYEILVTAETGAEAVEQSIVSHLT